MTNRKKVIGMLPTDEEVAKWYDENIDEEVATVSSSIYKFRLFLRDHFEEKLEPKVYDLAGHKYTKEII